MSLGVEGAVPSFSFVRASYSPSVLDVARPGTGRACGTRL